MPIQHRTNTHPARTSHGPHGATRTFGRSRMDPARIPHGSTSWIRSSRVESLSLASSRSSGVLLCSECVDGHRALGVSHQQPSGVISSHPVPSAVIRCHQVPSGAISSHQVPSAVHQQSSGAIRCNQLPSGAISSHQHSSGAHHWQFEGMPPSSLPYPSLSPRLHVYYNLAVVSLYLTAAAHAFPVWHSFRSRTCITRLAAQRGA